MLEELLIVKSLFPAGSPIYNSRIYLLGADGEMVEEGRKGEVYAAGLSTARGYVGGAQPDKFIVNKHEADPGMWRLSYWQFSAP